MGMGMGMGDPILVHNNKEDRGLLTGVELSKSRIVFHF